MAHSFFYLISLYICWDVFVVYADDQYIGIRLSGGSPKEGRVEVYQNGQWGVVCKDGWNDRACHVVCRMLHMSKGRYFLAQYIMSNVANMNFALDDTECSGKEISLNSCMHSHWWEHDCVHGEEVGCVCEVVEKSTFPSTPLFQTFLPSSSPSFVSSRLIIEKEMKATVAEQVSTSGPRLSEGDTEEHSLIVVDMDQYKLTSKSVNQESLMPGICDRERHMIRPFADLLPGIGRAEIRDSNGHWKTICDDNWDDIDAAVLCRCLGYEKSEYFRAIANPLKLLVMEPHMEIGFENVQCSSSHANVFDCPHRLLEKNSSCNGRTESAAVACIEIGAEGRIVLPPVFNLSCDGNFIDVVFSKAIDILIEPPCTFVQSLNATHTQVDLRNCPASHIEVDQLHKHYCYDLSEAPLEDGIFTASTWKQRICCSVLKTGHVKTDFSVQQSRRAAAVHASSKMNFSLNCYSDEKSMFIQDQNNTVHNNQVLEQGQPMFCRIQVSSWDPALLLVVPQCSFSSPKHLPGFQFIKHKCPTSIETQFFWIGNLSWGMHFDLPKFQDDSSISMNCQVYVCDRLLERKPYCDRSCQSKRPKRSMYTQQSAHHLVFAGPWQVIVSHALLPIEVGSIIASHNKSSTASHLGAAPLNSWLGYLQMAVLILFAESFACVSVIFIEVRQ